MSWHPVRYKIFFYASHWPVLCWHLTGLTPGLWATWGGHQWENETLGLMRGTSHRAAQQSWLESKLSEKFDAFGGSIEKNRGQNQVFCHQLWPCSEDKAEDNQMFSCRYLGNLCVDLGGSWNFYQLLQKWDFGVVQDGPVLLPQFIQFWLGSGRRGHTWGTAFRGL